jgi:hypothetical protein
MTKLQSAQLPRDVAVDQFQLSFDVDAKQIIFTGPNTNNVKHYLFGPLVTEGHTVFHFG